MNKLTLRLHRLPTYDFTRVSLALLMLLCLEPAFGFFFRTDTKTLFTALWMTKATLVRLVGHAGLLNAAVYYVKMALVDKSFVKNRLFKPWILLGVLFLLWSVVTGIVGMNAYRSFFGASYRFDGIFSYIAYFGIFLSASMITKPSQRNLLLDTFLYTSGLVALGTIAHETFASTVIMSRSGYTVAFSGTFINSNHYAYYLCVAAVLAAGRLLTAKKIWQKIISGIIFTLNFVVLLYNAAIGAYIALVLGFVVLFVIFTVKHGIKKTVLLAVLLCVMVPTTVFCNNGRVLKDIQKTGKELLNIKQTIEDVQSGKKDESALDDLNGGSGRVKIWKNTIKIIASHPLFGVGPENVYDQIERNEGSGNMPHNEYLQIAADMGMPGLLIYLCMLVIMATFALRNVKKRKDSALVAGVGALTYFFSAFVGVGMTICAFMPFFLLGLLDADLPLYEENEITNTVPEKENHHA